jgi:lysophospholipase L1-like esterase
MVATAIRFLALGDSYTVGESVPPEEAWPAQLAGWLPDRVEVTVIAKTGWTSGELLDNLNLSSSAGIYDLVSLQIGVNDQYRSLPMDGFSANARLLLEQAHRYWTGERGGVFAVSIPDWGGTPFAADRNRAAVAAGIDEYNAGWRAAADATGIPFANVTPISRRYPHLVTDDGLHPSVEQYRLWLDAIGPVASSLLTAWTE